MALNAGRSVADHCWRSAIDVGSGHLFGRSSTGLAQLQRYAGAVDRSRNRLANGLHRALPSGRQLMHRAGVQSRGWPRPALHHNAAGGISRRAGPMVRGDRISSTACGKHDNSHVPEYRPPLRTAAKATAFQHKCASLYARFRHSCIPTVAVTVTVGIACRSRGSS